MKPHRAEGMMTMHKFRRAAVYKLRVLKHAEAVGDGGKACRYFGFGRASFYRWRAAYRQHGVAGFENRKTILKNPANRTAPEIVEKVLHLRRTYHLGPMRIVRYLARCHAIKLSDAGVYRILKRHGLTWTEPFAGRHARPQDPHQALREAGARTSDPGRGEVPEVRWQRRKAGQALSVHGHR